MRVAIPPFFFLVFCCLFGRTDWLGLNSRLVNARSSPARVCVLWKRGSLRVCFCVLSNQFWLTVPVYTFRLVFVDVEPGWLLARRKVNTGVPPIIKFLCIPGTVFRCHWWWCCCCRCFCCCCRILLKSASVCFKAIGPNECFFPVIVTVAAGAKLVLLCCVFSLVPVSVHFVFDLVCKEV